MAKKWFVMLSWQGCSVILCVIAAICTVLARKNGRTLPITQLMVTYSILCVKSLCGGAISGIPWGRYFILAVLNFAGDISMIYAYTLTSLSSSMLLATTVIFWVAPLSYFVFGRVLSWQQVFSIFMCFFGVFMIFLSDGAGDSRLIGNLVAVFSAICYSIANIMQEALVHEASTKEYLFGFTMCITPLSIIGAVFIEWQPIINYNWNMTAVCLILSYSVLLAVYYLIVPYIMLYSNATEMNISFLSSNFLSLGVSIIAFGQKASWLYLVGFIFVPIAIVIFSMYPVKEYDLIESAECK